MQEGIYIAASGAFKQERKLQTISNNLANLGNMGFKRDGLVFREMIPPFNGPAQPPSVPDLPVPGTRPPFDVSYVGITDFFTDTRQGTLRQTGNSLDVALEGNGYFVVQTPQGDRYTRNGNFKLSADGFLATQEGHKVVNEEGDPIKIDTAQGGTITIDTRGNISVGKGLSNQPLGKMRLADFADPSVLVKEGDGLFRSGARPETPKEVVVSQGFLETSNVNSVEEMTEMIMTLRAFEAYQKMVQSIDEADDQVVNSLGRVG